MVIFAWNAISIGGIWLKLYSVPPVIYMIKAVTLEYQILETAGRPTDEEQRALRSCFLIKYIYVMIVLYEHKAVNNNLKLYQPLLVFQLTQ